MTVSERISALRGKMAEHGVDAYVIPSADYHQSEYVGDHFKAREFVTGFTGSVATAVITADDAALWVDGRYFIQAERQLAGSEVRMFKMGVDGFDTIVEYLEKAVPQGGKLGFDGRVVAYEEGKEYAEKMKGKDASVEYSLDLVHEIWNDRPAALSKPVFVLETRYSGETVASKLARLRKKMVDAGATHHVVATLDDIAWLLNLRGGREIANTPLFLSYFMMDAEKAALYADEGKFSPEIKAALERDGVRIKPYNGIYADIAGLEPQSILMIDPELVNYALVASTKCRKVEKANPAVMFKACKNETELENIRKAHIKDSVAQTKFMHWIKTNAGKIDITEISAGEKLERLRAEQDGFLWPSFAPIVAYKEHAAMAHYHAEPETNKSIRAEHMVLTDSGGNYMEGATDVSRTYVLGEISHELKTHFTAVVRGVINLSTVRFLKGVHGFNLDVLARRPLWDVGLDFKHGTGHGVGYLTTIHEAPCRIRWQVPANKPIQPPLEEGMMLSNEPAAYVEGSHGIRIENEIVVRKGEANDQGQFMYFETVTFTPIDLDAILPEMLTPAEKEFLNDYHKKVYELVGPHMDDTQREWLKTYTREI
ncbi:MAG: aminopeptidase P family protein [Defluviitaleaceae bacterium]|nr:aminopeptidase P family protein [Defluviitaleaceae bacterium]